MRTAEPDIGDIRIQKTIFTRKQKRKKYVLSAKNIFIQHIPAKKDSSKGCVLREHMSHFLSIDLDGKKTSHF